MKKIIAAFDGLKYSDSTEKHAVAITKGSGAYLVGVFMEDRTYNSYKIYELVSEQGVTEDKVRKFEKQDQATRDASVKKFESVCKTAGITYSVHRDHNFALQDLKHESIYADLLVIDSKETLSHHNEKIPTRFIRELLADAQCPVLLVPKKYKPIEKVVLLYDGEPSSVHAIKMFSYLMPEWGDVETEVISVNPVNTNLHIKDNKLMKEFMKRHHPKAKYIVMKGLAEDEILKYLSLQKDNALVVLGAYRRSAISRWFRESMADVLMKELKLPLFIAHNK